MNADEQTIRNLVAQWHRATAAGVVDTVLGLMSEDVVFLIVLNILLEEVVDVLLLLSLVVCW